MKLPNLITIGAMKSGTTSLHSYLDSHPEIQMSQLKELNFSVKRIYLKRELSIIEVFL